MTDLLAAVESALIETNGGFTGGQLIGELGDVATRLVAALEKRGVHLTLEGSCS